MPKGKRVLWDEKNLDENEEYRRQNPVTMRITEPKTPFEYGVPEEEGDFENEAVETEGEMTWDPKVNALARKVKEEISKEFSGPVAPISSSGRPMLSAGVTDGKLLKEELDKEFKHLRRAVYADEGAKFKSSLAQKNKDDEESDDDEDEEKEGEKK